MKKLILIGRSEAGKTTLTQALMGEKVHYYKTQYVNYYSGIIDTPGEYVQVGHLGHALAVYTYEADVVGLLCSAREPYSLFPPCVAAMSNRETIGIVTQINKPDAKPDRAEKWLRLAGCKTVFRVDSKTGEGILELLSFLKEPGDRELPWEKKGARVMNDAGSRKRLAENEKLKQKTKNGTTKNPIKTKANTT